MNRRPLHILVTGVLESVGREIAAQAVSRGDTVWGVGRYEDVLLPLQKDIGSSRFSYSVGDASHERDVHRMAQEMAKNGFMPDVVVLNSAGYARDIFPRYDKALVHKSIATNFLGPFLWAEEFLPTFLEKKSGQFILISSTSAFRPEVNSISYTSSRAGLAMAFRTLSLRYAENGVGFKTVYFGPVATSLSPYWLSPSGGARYFFVIDAKRAARYVLKAIRSKGDAFFFPRLLMFLVRIFLFPDRLFVAISRYLKK